MLYLLAIINLVLTSLSGLAFYNIYRSTKGLGWLEIAVMFISIILLLITNIGIIWVNAQRGKMISQLKKTNLALKHEIDNQKKSVKESTKEQD